MTHKAYAKIRCNCINTASIRRETREGRKVMIIPSATLPDNIVMNGIRYRGDEIEKSYKTLERTHAPLGHPAINGKDVPASDPEAVTRHGFGAWNENVCRKDGRVFSDKIIDVETAKNCGNGRRVLDAISKGGPIHTSTGLFLNLTTATNDDAARWIASDMHFDHDAILLDDPPAATPEQGVGMLVNRDAPQVISSALPEGAGQEINTGFFKGLRALSQWGRAPTTQNPTTQNPTTQNPTTQNKEKSMSTDDNIAGFETRLKQIETTIAGIGDTVTNAVSAAVSAAVKPIIDAQEAATNAVRTDLTTRIINAGLRGKTECEHLPTEVLQEIAQNAKAGKAASIGHGKTDKGNDTHKAYCPNINIKDGTNQ